MVPLFFIRKYLYYIQQANQQRLELFAKLFYLGVLPSYDVNRNPRIKPKGICHIFYTQSTRQMKDQKKKKK